ncbi:MAG TPA: tripartite tricarboxylate transporter substrate binding protein, partial [Hydrogenophaga sp.]
MTWQRRGFSLSLTAMAAASGLVLAQSVRRAWNGAVVQLIVVYPPGGVSDAAARGLAQAFKAVHGISLVVQNRPGAGGWIGLDAVSRAKPDGLTLAFSAISPLTLNPLTRRHLADLGQRVEPVASVMRTPVLILGTSALKGSTFKALIDQAKEGSGAVRWATSGVATTGHLVMAQVARQSRTRMIHVAYRGGGQPINEALGGQFEVMSTNLAPLQFEYVRRGVLKALAVGAPHRLAALPEVPTLTELGYPSANLSSLFGVFAPAGMPFEHVEELNHLINQALNTEA